jgi:hypothetical protein
MIALSGKNPMLHENDAFSDHGIHILLREKFYRYKIGTKSIRMEILKSFCVQSDKESDLLYSEGTVIGLGYRFSEYSHIDWVRETRDHKSYDPSTFTVLDIYTTTKYHQDRWLEYWEIYRKKSDVL